MPKFANINEYGEIVWPYMDKDIRDELKARVEGSEPLGFFRPHLNKYISCPINERHTGKIQRFAEEHDVIIVPNKTHDLSIENATSLIWFFTQKRFNMSGAEQPSDSFTLKLNKDISPSIQAGIEYALHTQRCFIADTNDESRRLIALLSIYEANVYPCMLTCHTNDKEIWLKLIRKFFPNNIIPLDLDMASANSKNKEIWIVEFEKLSSGYYHEKMGRLLKPYILIVDEANSIKNPESKRSQFIFELNRLVFYTFLVTDFPVDLSPEDLIHPLRLLKRKYVWEQSGFSFGDLTSDPIQNRKRTRFKLNYEETLRRLDFNLRSTCLLRRGGGTGSNALVKFADIALDEYSKYLTIEEAAQVSSSLRRLGLQKLTHAVRWINDFKQQHQDNFLVFAHHNDVVANLSKYVLLPAIYGKVDSKGKRNRIVDSLEGGLIVSNRTQFDWELENVTAVIFVELNITPEYFENILDKVRKGRQNDLPVSVYFLCSRNPADINTLKRLMFRAVDARVVMDGIEEPNMAAPDF